MSTLITPETFRQTMAAMWQSMTPDQRAAATPWLNAMCGNGTTPMLPGAATPAHAEHAHACTGQCGGKKCNNKACGMWEVVPGVSVPLTNTGGPPLMNIPGMAPECYDCECIDPCLIPLLLAARLDFDDAAWQELWRREADIVHMNQDAGAAVVFQDAPPLAAGQELLYVQELGQQLPFVPALIKVVADWTGAPMPSKVSMQFYSGPKGLFDLDEAGIAASLITISRPMTLGDFVCGTACYVQRFPRINGCKMRGFPYQRALYVRVTAGALGETELAGIDISIIKQGTNACRNDCDAYKIKL